MTPRTPEQRLDHAVRQKRHEDNKRKTHVRRQIWVPSQHLNFYKAVLARTQKLWAYPGVTPKELTHWVSRFGGQMPDD